MGGILARTRAGITEIPVYVPGRPTEELERELGIVDAVKLASNENPQGPSAAVHEAVMKALARGNRYPDQGCFYVKKALARRLGVAPEMIAVGNGTSDLIEMVARMFVDPDDEVVVAHPSFLMYRLATRIMRGREVLVPLREYTLDLPAMARAVTDRTKVVFVCNPNNPTGTMVTAPEVERLVKDIPSHVLLVFDEAYYEYVDQDRFPQTIPYLESRDNVIVMRSFSKVHSLAGLRVGYAIAHPEVAATFDRVRQPFTVNRLAQAAAVASLEDQERVRRTVEENRRALAFLTNGFERLGLEYVPTVTNFLLVRFRRDAREVARELERRGVIVRPLIPFGMPPEYARVSTGTEKDNEALIRALEEVTW